MKKERKVIVAGIIIDGEGKVLVTQRKKGDARGGGWEFPGGKVELEETPEEALARELKEELEIEVEILDIFSAVQYAYDDIVVFIVFYLCRLKNKRKNLVLHAHDNYKWVDSDELDKVDFLPADSPIIPKLKERLAQWKKK